MNPPPTGARDSGAGTQVRASRPMVDPPFIPSDASIIAVGFIAAVATLLLGLVLWVGMASAQTVPFDGRIDSLTDGSPGGAYALDFGVVGGYQAPTYANVVWIPTSTGIFCGFETYGSGVGTTTVSLTGVGIATVSWTQAWAQGNAIRTYTLWPEECFTYTSGTSYTFAFSSTNNSHHYIAGAYGTSTNYEKWQYNDGLGWRIVQGHPYFSVIGTNNSSTVAWYASSTPQYPYDFNPESTVCADWGPFTPVCNMLIWLFKPSDGAMMDFEIVRDDMLASVPLGYFTLAADAFNGIEATGASSTVITVSTTLGTIEMWNTSTTANSSLWKTVSPPLFAIERVGMWMGFLFYLYVRARDLHV